MPDSIPAWFAIPAAIAAWGAYIAIVIRDRRNRKPHITINNPVTRDYLADEWDSRPG